MNDREIYLTEDPIEAGSLLDKAIIGYRSDGVEESRSLSDALERRRTGVLN